MIHPIFQKSSHRNGRTVLKSFVAISLLSLLSISITNRSNPSLAQSVLPDPGGLPGRREGAATRGCSTKGLTALVPRSNVGKTLAEYPTFFVYIPENRAGAAEIGLEDENGTLLYYTKIEKTLAPGFFTFTMPRSAESSSLELGKNYKWYFQLLCGEEPGGFVEGWVQRVAASNTLENELRQASQRDRIRIYAREQMWYDALEILAELRQATPEDLTVIADWKTLLKELELEHLARELVNSPSDS